MAIRQSAATGNANVGATWVGGVAPGVGDTFEVLSGHTVTFTVNLTVLGWTQKGSGKMVLNAGVVLTATASDMIVEGDGNDTVKVSLASGAALMANPGSGVTINLRIGADYYRYAEVEARGTEGSRCKIGKTNGALGTFNIVHGDGFIWMNGLLDCEYTDVGDSAGIVELYPRNNGKFILKNCTVNGSLTSTGYNLADSPNTGEMKFENTVFNGNCAFGSSNTRASISINRCEFFGTLTINRGDGTDNTLTFLDSIVHQTFGGAWYGGTVDIRGLLLFHRDATKTTGQYAFMGKFVECYAFADYTDNPASDGNPHFFSTGADGKTQRVERCAIEYRGNAGLDTGDAGDLSNGTLEVVDTILLPSNTPGMSSGAFWFLGGSGLLDVNHCTIHCGGSGGVRFPHDGSMSAGQAKVKNSILWNDTGVSYGVYNDTPGTSAVDALRPTDFIGNVLAGLSTGTNVVNSVSTPIVGVEACEFSVLPTGNTSLAVSGIQFVDNTVGFLTWAQDVLGLTGTPDQIRNDALDAIRADKHLVRTSLLPHVRDGYKVQASALATSANDGTTPGAVQPPLPWTAWPESLTAWNARVVPKALLRAQEMIDAAALRLGGGGDTDTMAITYYDAMRVYQNLAIQYPEHATLFLNAAEAAYYLYVVDFLIPGGYAAPGHWNFTTGLYQMYTRLGTQKYKDAILGLSLNAAFAADGVPSMDGSIDGVRENSYAIMSHLNARKVGQAPRAVTDVRIADLEEQYTRFMNDELIAPSNPDVGTFGGVTLQSFMVAIMAEAYKMLYDDSDDASEKAAIIMKVQNIADHTWDDKWRPEYGYFWYGVDDGPDLNLYIAPMYAWLWNKTGEARNRDRFDIIFSHGVTGGWLDPHKQFNQQNIKTREAIEYRQGTVDTPDEGGGSGNQDAPFIPGDAVVITGGPGDMVLIIPWDGKR